MTSILNVGLGVSRDTINYAIPQKLIKVNFNIDSKKKY